jgi:hypothetical protein
MQGRVARAPPPAFAFVSTDRGSVDVYTPAEGKMPSGRRRYKFEPRRCMSAKVRNWSQSKAVTACFPVRT